MSLYTNGSPPPTSAAIPHRVTEQYVARAHLTRRQRAKLAADLANGTATISPLTATQAAAMARVPVTDVAKVRRNGNASKPRRHRETLADHIARSSPAERAQAGREIGIDVIWDQMISPVIDEERGEALDAIRQAERAACEGKDADRIDEYVQRVSCDQEPTL